MPSLSQRKSAFIRRVNYAHAAFLRGEDSREFDNCFEMYDGEFVVTALIRRAATDEDLKAAILGSFTSSFSSWEALPWQATAARHERIATHRLADLAATRQIEAEWHSVHIFMPQLGVAKDPAAVPYDIIRTEGSAVLKESFYARNLREATQAVKSWGDRTVMGAPFLSLLAEIKVVAPTGESFIL